ncbi:DUF2773 domain-containing protein [Escherichia coli]|nr:DUF2773 domain-containing protein [Escherichia coli]WQB86310.1 DUF2773 domain-containing protein [Escherichia coli]
MLQSRNDHLRQTALHNAPPPFFFFKPFGWPPGGGAVFLYLKLGARWETGGLKGGPSFLFFVEQPDLSLLRDLVKTGATRKIRSEARHRLEEKQ